MCEVCMGRNSEKCPVCGPRPSEKITCPHCGGWGVVNCVAYEVGTDDVVDVTGAFYSSLPDTEDEALWLYKGDAERCPECLGSGKVYEEDGQYYPA